MATTEVMQNTSAKVTPKSSATKKKKGRPDETETAASLVANVADVDTANGSTDGNTPESTYESPYIKDLYK